MKAKQRYTNGLDKLAFAESQVYEAPFSKEWFCYLCSAWLCVTQFNNVALQVGEMKKELVDLQPKLEQAKIDNTKMMKVQNFTFSLSLNINFRA